jgi:hypothetical protein
MRDGLSGIRILEPKEKQAFPPVLGICFAGWGIIFLCTIFTGINVNIIKSIFETWGFRPNPISKT